MDRETRVFVAGSETLIGAAVVRQVAARGVQPLGLAADRPSLTRGDEVDAFFARHRPEIVIHAAGLSGGIAANQRHGAELARDNMLVNVNVLEAAYRHGTRRLLYLASSCCYPRLCRQPMAVEDLWSGPLEPTNEAYAAAKLAGIALCRAYRNQQGVDFRVGVPANAFGPGDDLDSENAHVISALMVRIHEAHRRGDPAVVVWGSGRPRREFIYADDLADACLTVIDADACPDVINLGGGHDVSIADLAERIKQTVGYQGRLEFDATRNDGMPRKLLESSPLAALGFRPRTSLDDALTATYRWYLSQIDVPGATHVG